MTRKIYHHKNGIAEQKNRTLVETTRYILVQSALPISLWAEAIATANYVKKHVHI